MFKNADRDPLAVPSRAPRRVSVGPTRRTAGVPWNQTKVAPQQEHAQYDVDPHNWSGDDAPHPDAVGPQPSAYSTGPEGSFYGDSEGNFDEPASGWEHELYAPEGDPEADHQMNALKDQWQSEGRFASLPRPIARVLDREARTFMEAEGNTNDRSELLYRARRHAGNLTSAWSPKASEKVTEAFCGRVAALIPSPRKVAAQPVTEFADFDDSLLY